MTKLQEFIDYLNNEVRNHSIYVWGAQGQNANTISEAWIRRREANTGGYGGGTSYADAAVAYWREQCSKGYQKVLRAFDCSGLGIYWLYNLKHLFSSDRNAHGMMGTCTIIPFSERKKGCWVFRVNSSGRATHIGYMVDDVNVVHAKGRAYGVVKETAKASYWHRCGIPKVFASEINSGGTSTPIPNGAYTFTRLLKYGCKGNDVKELKVLLAKAGYTGLTLTNGNFYSSTRATVKKFQKARGLDEDGVAGELTISVLGGTWAS